MIYAITYKATGYFDPIKYRVCEFAAVCIDTGDTFHCCIKVDGPWQDEKDRIYHSDQEQLCFDDFIIIFNEWLGPGYHEWLGLMFDDEFYLRNITINTKLYTDKHFFYFNSKDIDHKDRLVNQAKSMADIYITTADTFRGFQ